MTKRVFVGVLLLATTAILSAQGKSPIQGVWRVIESSGGPGVAGTTIIKNPQPGYYIFTDGGHYSITRVTGEKQRMVAKDAAKPTIEELQDANRFQAQFGTYEVKGDAITLRLSVARNPPTMNNKSASSGNYRLDGNTLMITLKNAQGFVSTVTLSRVE